MFNLMIDVHVMVMSEKGMRDVNIAGSGFN